MVTLCQMDIDHAAGHFDFRVQDVILFINQKYDATVLIIRGCRCVNAMVVSTILIKSEIFLILMCFQEGCDGEICLRKLLIKEIHFLGRRSGGPKATTIPHYYL